MFFTFMTDGFGLQFFLGVHIVCMNTSCTGPRVAPLNEADIDAGERLKLRAQLL